MNLLSRLINLLKMLFTGENKNAPPSVTPTPVVPTPVPTPPPPLEVDDPPLSSPDAKITTFLWKPVSDTPPKVMVVSVSCDDARAEDVRIQIKNNKGRIIRTMDINGRTISLSEKYNIGGIKRNNLVPGHKLGRFNFKPGPKAVDFVPQAPLTVSFFLEINGKRERMTVMGKKSITITDPTKRLELK